MLTEEPQAGASETVPDPWSQINPGGQHVFFWYAFPPQSPADHALNLVVDQFNQTNEYNIFVDAYNQSTVTEIMSRTLPLLNTPDMPALLMSTPDLILLYQNHTGQIPALLDLHSLWQNPQWGLDQDQQASLSEHFLAAAQSDAYRAEIAGMPIGSTASLLFYNQNWLYELGYLSVPKTPEEFARIVCLAKSSSFRPGLPARAGIVFSPDVHTLATWIWAFGGNLYNPDTGGYQFNSTAGVAAVQFLQTLMQQGCAIYLDQENELKLAFANGETLFLQTSSAAIVSLSETIPVSGFTWNAALLPATGAQNLLMATPWSISITDNGSREQQLAAWLFIKFALEPGAQSTWIGGSGEFPLNAAALESARIHPVYERAFEWARMGSSYNPPLPGKEVLDLSVKEALQALAGGADAVRTLQNLDTQANQLMLQYLSGKP